MATATCKKKVGDYEIDIDLDKSLGQGSYGKVFTGRHANTKKEFAAKVIEWEKDLVTEEMDHEANLMKRISDHINVLKIFDYIKIEIEKKRVIVQGWLILELCTFGNIADFAEERQLSTVQQVDLILQGSRGLQHLHSQTPSIIHQDIKLANLLVTGSEGDPVVKVGDFGISRFFAHSRDQSMTNRHREGTEYHWAPELFLLGKNYVAKFNKSVDVFAMGVSATTLVNAQDGEVIRTYTVAVENTKKGLGKHIHEENITDVEALIMKDGDSDEMKQFKRVIASMLAKDTQERLTIHEVVDQLTQLRSDLENMPISIQLDTVWKPVKLQVRREHLKTAESRANVREVMEQLRHVVQEEEVKNTLLALESLEGVNTLWIHEGERWTSCGAPDECRTTHVCVGYVSDGLVLTGGRDSAITSDDVPTCYCKCYHFSLSKREWRRLRDMITPRAAASAAEMKDMMLMVAGGHDISSDPSRACEVLDVRSGIWFSASPLPDGISGDVLTGASKGRAYILASTLSEEVRFLEYDPESDVHNKRPSPPVVFDICMASLAGAAGKVFLICEDVDSTTKALQYYPATQQWHQLEPPSVYLPPWISNLTIVKQGKILLCGTSRTSEKEDRNLMAEYNVHSQKCRVLDNRLPFKVVAEVYMYYSTFTFSL